MLRRRRAGICTRTCGCGVRSARSRASIILSYRLASLSNTRRGVLAGSGRPQRRRGRAPRGGGAVALAFTARMAAWHRMVAPFGA